MSLIVSYTVSSIVCYTLFVRPKSPSRFWFLCTYIQSYLSKRTMGQRDNISYTCTNIEPVFVGKVATYNIMLLWCRFFSVAHDLSTVDFLDCITSKVLDMGHWTRPKFCLGRAKMFLTQYLSSCRPASSWPMVWLIFLDNKYKSSGLIGLKLWLKGAS